MNRQQWLEGSSDPVEIEMRRALDAMSESRLDDVSSRRIWARVAEPSASRGRVGVGWWWFLGGIGTAAAAAVALFLVLGARGPRVAQSSAPVLGQGMEPAVARAESAAAVERTMESGPAALKTNPHQSMLVKLARAAEAEVGPASHLTVDDRGIPSLDEGEAFFRVQPQPPGRHFEVAAGPYRIVVVGTKFRVTVNRDRVGVSVDDGRVEVWRDHLVAELARGDFWSSGSGAGATTGRLTEHATQPATSPTRRRPVSLAPGEEPTSPETRKVDAPPPVSTGAVGNAVGADPSGEARAAVAAGEPRRALEIYRALAQRGGPAAENARYEEGRILRDKLGQPRDAVAVWKSYLRDYPAGLLRSEASLSIIDTLASVGDTDAALAESRSFQARFPDSERRSEVARVAGDIYRAKGDCRAAVQEYRTALAASGPRGVADHAAFHRAACLLVLNDPAGPEALRAYLDQFPVGRYRSEASRLLQSADAPAGNL